MSKKLATIITNVPVQFHEETFRLKEKNSSALAEIFNELEFKTLGKRILGDAFSVTGNIGGGEEKGDGSFSKIEPSGNAQEQTDLFGNRVNVKPHKQRANKTNESEVTADAEDNSEDNDFGGNPETALVVNKNINNTEHDYKSVVGDKEIAALLKILLEQNEICIDTETTGVDANNVSLVGLSFSYKEHEGYFLPIENDGAGKTGATHILKILRPLFDNENITWIGQNLKYDF